MCDENFNESHSSAVACVQRTFKIDDRQFDDSFFLSLASAEVAVSWNETHLAVELHGAWQFPIFLEALFAYGLCKSAENGLTRLLDHSSATVVSADIVEFTSQIAKLEGLSASGVRKILLRAAAAHGEGAGL